MWPHSTTIPDYLLVLGFVNGLVHWSLECVENEVRGPTIVGHELAGSLWSDHGHIEGLGGQQSFFVVDNRAHQTDALLLAAVTADHHWRCVRRLTVLMVQLWMMMVVMVHSMMLMELLVCHYNRHYGVGRRSGSSLWQGGRHRATRHFCKEITQTRNLVLMSINNQRLPEILCVQQCYMLPEQQHNRNTIVYQL